MRRARVLVGSLLVLVLLAGAAIAFVAWREREARVWTDGGTIRTQAKHVSPRSVLWTPPVALDAPINTDTDEYEPRTSGDGQWLFFVRGRAALNADLYVAQRTLDGWANPQPLEGLNTAEFDELGPCPSFDGRVLYFASNRDGGEGGYDLWRAERQDDGSWSTPVNLGPTVNSPYDEYGPTLAPDGVTLVYASNRPNASRAVETTDTGEPTWSATLRTNIERAPFDLYAVSMDDENATATTIDALDSPFDEGAPVFSPAGDFLYFASNREGGAGGFDLYRARVRDGDFDEPESLGAPINTVRNEMDPAVWQGGFALVFSRETEVGPERERTYDLFESESREVYSERDPSLAAIDWARWLPALWWLLAFLSLLLLLLFLWRQLHNQRLSLLVRCLLASALLHCLLLLLLSVWQVTTGLSDLWKSGNETRVALTAGASESSIVAQVRGAMQMPVELPMLAVTTERPPTPLVETTPAPERANLAPSATAAPTAREVMTTATTPAEAQPTANDRPERTVELPPIESAALSIESLAGPSAQPIETAAESSLTVNAAEARDASVPRAAPVVEASDDAPSPLIETAVNDDASREPIQEARDTTAPSQPVESLGAAPSARPEVIDDLPPIDEPILLAAGGDEPLPIPVEDPRAMSDSAEPELESQIITPNAANDQPARLLTRDDDAANDPPVEAVRIETDVATATEPAATAESIIDSSAPIASAAPDRTRSPQPARSLDDLPAEPLPELAHADDLALPESGATDTPADLTAEESTVVVTAPNAAARDERAAREPVESPVADAPLVALSPMERADAVAPATMESAEVSREAADAQPTVTAPTERTASDAALALDAMPLDDVMPLPDDASNREALAQADDAATINITAPSASALQDVARDPSLTSPEHDAPPERTTVEVTTADADEAPTALLVLEEDPASTDAVAPIEPRDRAPDDLLLALDAMPLDEVPLPTEAIAAYSERLAPNRLELVKQRGGSDATERAVNAALRWLADHQANDGSWSTRHFDDGCEECGGEGRYQTDVATTGLSLLAFLGAGHTHFSESAYRDGVQRAIDWLRARQRGNGDLRAGETMYSHGIATIALSEAYGMTRDEALRPVVERAVRFIVDARHDDSGGWRYEPGQFGDTSVFGWQVMALISAQRAGIEIPLDANAHARRWLDRVAHERFPGRYAYQPGQPFSPAMTAEAMFCQQLLGRRSDEPRMIESAEYIVENLPEWDRRASTYYWYYATLALYQHGGESWSTWNDQLTATLLANQRMEGPAAGSWDLIDRWAVIGGRVYQTALAALMLEVYYRYLPLYGPTLRDQRSGNP